MVSSIFMRTLHRDEGGVSEVVGALMLVLIVVASLSAFFVFISEKQQDLENQDRLETIKELESIGITSIEPSDTDSDGDWDQILVSIASIHLEKSTITTMYLSNTPVENIYFRNSGGIYDIQLKMSEGLKINGRELKEFMVYLENDDFYGSAPTIKTTDYIKLDLLTSYSNSFSRTFTPPQAIFVIDVDSYWDAGTSSFMQMVVLDGSKSHHSDPDMYIVQWRWDVKGDDDGDSVFGETILGGNLIDEESFTVYGEKTRVDDDLTAPAGTDHQITLTVYDNMGLVGTETFIYNY
jgi:hypothetical protein